MCTSCGCAPGNIKIEGEESHHHHAGENGQHNSHDHDHAHVHANHQQDTSSTVIQHHYHGTTHIHYHISSEDLPNIMTKESSTNHSHAGFDIHSHEHSHINPSAEHKEKFTAHISGDNLHFGKGAAHSHAPGLSQSRMVQIEQDILGKNNQIAAKNRDYFARQNIKVLNLLSSPGSGKTTLLTNTLTKLIGNGSAQLAVIEGDQQTANDAERIRATGVRAIQVNTGKGCHLDAQMVSDAVARIGLEKDSLLFIENVGNLVCPASFDLGEQEKVTILSVTEGEDKPLKYPDMFSVATLVIINKVDLLPYVDFDVENCIANVQQVNPKVKVLLLSAKTDEGMVPWLEYLAAM